MISTLGSRALLVRKKTRHNKNVSCEKWLPILWRSEWLFYRQAEFQISISIVFWKTLAGVNSTIKRVGLNLLHPTAYLAPIYTSHFYDEDTLLYVLTCFCRFALALYWKGCAQAREFGFLASALFSIPTLNLGLFSSWKPIILEWFAIPVPDSACNKRERESCQKHYNLTN